MFIFFIYLNFLFSWIVNFNNLTRVSKIRETVSVEKGHFEMSRLPKLFSLYFNMSAIKTMRKSLLKKTLEQSVVLSSSYEDFQSENFILTLWFDKTTLILPENVTDWSENFEKLNNLQK